MSEVDGERAIVQSAFLTNDYMYEVRAIRIHIALHLLPQ